MSKAAFGLAAGVAMLLSIAAPAFATGPVTKEDAAMTTILPGDYLAGAWWLYKSVFVDEGRVVDQANGGISHSEGQGYGMLMAVAANDQAGFEALWSWTQKELRVRGDALSAWKWDPKATPHVADSNNATDGDLLVAWALARAARIWNAPDYAEAARMILKDLESKAIIESQDFGTILLPAAHGFSAEANPDGPIVNLSYWVFPALDELGQLDESFPAKALLASGQRLLEKGRFGSSSLPADWLSLKSGDPTPANGFASVFGYEAVRVPLYAAWLGGPSVALLAGLERRWSEDPAGPHVMELSTAAPLAAMPQPGYRAVSGLLSCSLGRSPAPRAIPEFELTDYYSTTLHFLSVIALSERFPQCLPDQN